MRIKLMFTFVCLFIGVTMIFAQGTSNRNAHTHLRNGDKEYQNFEYNKAEENYRKALEGEASAKGSYNLGNSIYNQQRYEEAIAHYEQATQEASTAQERSYAYHNLGNTHYQMEAYDKSVEAYKNALRNSPKDMETKKNLAMAQRLLQMQQQQQQQQQENQDQNNEDQQDQNEQQQQQEENEDEKKENQDQNQNQQNQDEQQEQEQPQQPKDMNKEEARKLLDIMEDEEKKVQEKLRKGSGKKYKSDKDW